MVLGVKRYNYDYVDTSHLALDFEHCHHISITKLETMSERHATKMGGWVDSNEGATMLQIGTLVQACIRYLLLPCFVL